ncbi:hypothetical protein CLU79DRAFT_746544 [Phycomyces nitens]|nr:hypothetical protein CLU79DRAFT_746544 [Phycomyces nitens]
MSKFAIALALGAPLAFFTTKYIWDTLAEWMVGLIEMCIDAVYHDADNGIRGVYTGFKHLDMAATLYVSLFKFSFRIPIGRAIDQVMLSFCGVILAVMNIEGSRRQISSTPLGWSMVWAMIGNMCGVSAIFPVYIPIYLYFSPVPNGKNVKAFTVAPNRANAILFTTFFGYFIPTAYMIAGVEPESHLEETFIALWQIGPIFTIPLGKLVERGLDIINPYTPASNDKDVAERLAIVDSKNAVERLYLFLGVLCIMVYYGTYIHLSWSGVNLWDALVELIAAPVTLPTGLTYFQVGGFLASYTFFMDLFSTLLGCVLWAAMDDGFKGVAILLITSPIVGPSAATCIYAAYRENRLLDTRNMVKKTD